jgi:hypothetical protein
MRLVSSLLILIVAVDVGALFDVWILLTAINASRCKSPGKDCTQFDTQKHGAALTALMPVAFIPIKMIRPP